MPYRWRTLPMLALFTMLTLNHAPAESAKGSYLTDFARWRAASNGFSGWQRSGVLLEVDGTLRLNRASAQAARDPYPRGGYHSRNFYNGGDFVVGEAISPRVQTVSGFREAIASWNAETPPGTWIEAQISAQLGTRWTKWFSMGVWASDQASVERHSVDGQADSDGTVAVDTLLLHAQGPAATGFRLKIRLFSEGITAPVVRNAAVTTSTSPVKPKRLREGDRTRWNRTLSVPECSQMVYRDGGEAWCSPTSMSMVLAYWRRVAGPCEPRVRAAVEGVYDWRYDGHGNWSFNVAYGATQGWEGYVARFTSLAQAEAWIAAGVPVILSYGWKKGALTGAPISSSNGHLAILVGFDAAGNPVVNDPAAADDLSVQRTYSRAQLEALWLEHSGGTVYLIYPPGHVVPSL